MVKLLLLTMALSSWVLPAASQNQKGTGQSGGATRTCTDLSGEPVPCPEGHNRIVLPPANQGSAELRRCADPSGNEVPCPGDNSAPAETSATTGAPPGGT